MPQDRLRCYQVVLVGLRGHDDGHLDVRCTVPRGKEGSLEAGGGAWQRSARRVTDDGKKLLGDEGVEKVRSRAPFVGESEWRVLVE